LDNSTIVKWLGVFILIFMAGSMFAGIFLYSEPQPTDNPDDFLPVSQDKEFSYSIDFNATVLKDLGSLRTQQIQRS
jgi:hypothetical protein